MERIEFADTIHARPSFVVPMGLLNQLRAGSLRCMACNERAIRLRGSAGACAAHQTFSSLQLRALRVAAITEDERGRQ